MAIPTTNVKMTDISSNVDGETSLLKPVSDYFKSPNVVASGLSHFYCSGATPYDRLEKLRTKPYRIGKFRGYNPTVNQYYWKSGLFYDWRAAATVHVPYGWHVATQSDWYQIFSSIDSNFQYGQTSLANNFKSGLTETQNPFSGWDQLEGDNLTGFNAHAIGLKWASLTDQNLWQSENFTSNFWMVTPDFMNPNVIKKGIWFNSVNNVVDITTSCPSLDQFCRNYDMYNIRLIKEDGYNPGYVEDIEGNIYKTVKIGDKVVTAENLRTTKDIYGNAFFDVGGGDIVFTQGAIVSSVALQYDQP